MKLLTLGINRAGKTPERLWKQLALLLTEEFPKLPRPEHPVEKEALSQLLFVRIPLEDNRKVPQVLEKLISAGFQISYLTYGETQRFTGQQDVMEPVPDTPDHAIASFRKAASNMSGIQLELLETLLKTAPAGNRKINLPTLHGFRRIDLNTIVRCESTDNYTIVFFTDRKKILVSRSLQEFESRLAASGFFRIHHKHLINTEHIVEYQKGKGGQVIMSDNSSIDVSVRKKTDFIRYINGFS